METKDFYRFEDTPSWAKIYSENEFIEISQKESPSNENYICHIYERILNISNEKTEDYLFRMWKINDSGTLQGGSVTEIYIEDKEIVKFNKILVIREGKIIDKSKDLNIRVFDDEKNSSAGNINRFKKINVIIQDLRINDCLIISYTINTIINNDIHKKFFKSIHFLPNTIWFYFYYSFKVIQNREENILLNKNNFDEIENKDLKKNLVILKKEDVFLYEEKDYKNKQNDKPVGEISIVSDSSWKDISNYIYKLYEKVLSESDIIDTLEYKNLNLTGKKDKRGAEIRKIIEYVQNDIYYLYDAYVMDGHEPQNCKETLSKKSGDCKAKSVLLSILLKSIDVKCDCILVKNQNDFFLKNTTPSPFSFNHVIVRIMENEKEYFIDPTLRDQYGQLGYRANIINRYYLPIIENSDELLSIKDDLNDLNIDKTIKIKIEKEEAVVSIKTTFKRESADIVRSNEKNCSYDVNLKYENDALYYRLSYSKERQINELIKNPKYEILSDDKDKNIISYIYTCTLKNPYDIGKSGNKILRYYNSLNSENIKNYKWNGVPINNFCSYSLKYVLDIESDLYIDKNDSIIKRNIDLDNNYFSFYNKKQIFPKRVICESEFKPKNYDFIEKQDIEKIKSDFKKIDEDNFGVGIIFINFFKYFLNKFKV